MLCEVYCHDLPEDKSNPKKIELKAFVIEWRILYKAYMQKSLSSNKIERFCQTQVGMKKRGPIQSRSNSPNKKEAPQKMKKELIKEQIKKLLLSSMKLKMKLKSQVTKLKKNYPIEESVILSHLNFDKLKIND
jgi:hypothetical protein